MTLTEEEKLKRTVELERLLQKAQAGDRLAADELLQSHRPIVLTYLRSRTRKPEDAEDLTQRTLINAYRKISSYQRTGPFSAWLLGIAANECRDYYKRVLPNRSKEISLDEPANLSAAEVQQREESRRPYDSVDNALFVEKLLRAMETACSATEQRVLKLAFTEATGEEASQSLGINQATVRSHLLRGREKLLAYLVQHDPEMFGGVEAIQEAVQQLLQDTEPENRLDATEMDALAHPTGRVKQFRIAVVKLARYLRLPITVLALLMGGDR